VPQARIWASDLAAPCCALTLDNVARLALQARIVVTRGDLFAPLRGQGLEATMDLVVMNPPYIPTSSLERRHAGLLDHEPREAFDGGPYGITILSRLMREAPPFLKPGGRLMFEFGLGQARLVQSLVERNHRHADCRFAPDADGAARVAVLTLAASPDGDVVDGLRPPTTWGLKGEHRERSEQAVPPFMTEREEH
jgi:release factor glutamine methyltransferase